MLKSKKWWFAAVLTVFLLATALTGCGKEEKAADLKLNEAGLYEFNFPNVPWADPVYIAENQGFFKEQGLKANFSGFLPNINDIVTGVASGNFPFACQHASTLAIGISNGYPIKAIAAGWATSKEKPMMSYVTLENSDIKSIADLKGHKVAIPSITETYWLETKDKFHLSSDDLNEVVLSYEKMGAALKAGQVDAIYIINPYTEALMTDPGYRVFGTLVDVVGEERGWPQQCVNLDFAKKHPDIVKKYVTAIANANDWAIAHPDEAGAVIAKALGVDASLGRIYNPVFPPHALIDKADAELWLGLADKYKLLKRPVTLDELYTNEYNPFYKA
ncbi:MAG TPA: ABC transporter substrate-binding protein [Desulfosporosinus sp.]|nr:ABC transporter substrate-binding protein [Desulfosporosinus sp.]